MTREEQIIEASQLYAKHQQKPFMDGARWADNNPRQDQIDALRMEYEKGRADAIAHPTGGELLHVLNKGAAIGRREMLDKACEWLEHRQVIDLVVPNIEKFINDFRKAMEQ